MGTLNLFFFLNCLLVILLVYLLCKKFYPNLSKKHWPFIIVALFTGLACSVGVDYYFMHLEMNDHYLKQWSLLFGGVTVVCFGVYFLVKFTPERFRKWAFFFVFFMLFTHQSHSTWLVYRQITYVPYCDQFKLRGTINVIPSQLNRLLGTRPYTHCVER